MGSTPPITIRLDGDISCRLYEDTRPHHLEISALQKGLVLLVDDKEMIEEGVGFGVPVVMYKNRPFFSGAAQTSIQSESKSNKLTKVFTIDTVSLKKFRKRFYLNERAYTFVQRRFHKIYTRNKSLASALTAVILLLKRVRVDTEFQKTQPKGNVSVSYTFSSNVIEVEVALADLDKRHCREILILNEQGASFFRKYLDSKGLILMDDQIGAWEPADAERVFLFNVNETTGYSLKSSEDAKLLRGREKIRGRYSWVGFSYSLRPQVSTFRYSIELINKR